MDRAIIMICYTQYVMGRANAICDMRIRYGPRECDKRYANTLWADMRYANTLWAARMRYAIREYAMGRANAICDMRIRYGPRECDKRYANRLRAQYGSGNC